MSERAFQRTEDFCILLASGPMCPSSPLCFTSSMCVYVCVCKSQRCDFITGSRDYLNVSSVLKHQGVHILSDTVYYTAADDEPHAPAAQRLGCQPTTQPITEEKVHSVG